jgi:DNA-binding GntR family transcriptional regulator
MISRSSQQPSGKTTAKQYVRDQLRRRILSGAIPGGSRLVQSEVAVELGVSTTPVREALHDLASEGLVKFGAHKGAVVHHLDLDELREVFELRRVLEPMVMELAIPRMTEEIVDHLDSLCDAMESTFDRPTWVELNREFHGVFMETSGWPRLASIVGALHDSASPFVALALRFRHDLFDIGNRDHRALADAARTKDVNAAMANIVDHMNITRSAIEDRMPESGGGGVAT